MSEHGTGLTMTAQSILRVLCTARQPMNSAQVAEAAGVAAAMLPHERTRQARSALKGLAERGLASYLSDAGWIATMDGLAAYDAAGKVDGK